ncbi:MAG: hypothetical protein Q7V02_08240 [Methylophilus sp.]|nr:hypothetical protein [Methylophilus sp.]
MKLILTLIFSFSVSVAFAEDMSHFASSTTSFAEDFTKKYPRELENVLKEGQKQTKSHEKTIERLQSKIIDAGVWTKSEASLYLLSLVNLPEVKEYEEKRNILSAEFKKNNMAISVLDIVTNNNQEKINKGTCIFGTSALSSANEANKVNDESWIYLEGKISEFGASKNIKMTE